MRLLASREHGRVELARKLVARGHDAAAVERVLDGLQRRRLLSDARFAEQYVAMRMRRGFGPLRIRAELRERGVDPEEAAAALDDGGHDWRALLGEVRARRFGDRPPTERAEQARQARFLVQRGFPEGLVRALLFDT